MISRARSIVRPAIADPDCLVLLAQNEFSAFLRINPATAAKDADIAAVQRHLEEFLGLNVQIKTDTDPRSGAVTIRYRTLDQLDLICQRLTGGDI